MIEYEINPESGVCVGCMYYAAKNIDVKIENRPNPCTMCSRIYTDHYKGSIMPLSYDKKVKVSREYKNIK
jgi:hypothetical protein